MACVIYTLPSRTSLVPYLPLGPDLTPPPPNLNMPPHARLSCFLGLVLPGTEQQPTGLPITSPPPDRTVASPVSPPGTAARPRSPPDRPGPGAAAAGPGTSPEQLLGGCLGAGGKRRGRYLPFKSRFSARLPTGKTGGISSPFTLPVPAAA